MKRNVLRMPVVASLAAAPCSRVGRLAGFAVDGRPLVDYPGSKGGVRVARVTSTVAARDDLQTLIDSDVLLAFTDDDLECPIIVDFLDAQPRQHRTLATGIVARDRHDNVKVEGREIEFRGRDRVVLSCGKSSVTLFADGRVIVKGTRLLSRASESNKIKGSSIALN